MKRKKSSKESILDKEGESSQNGFTLCGGKSIKKSLSGILKPSKSKGAPSSHLLRRGIRFSSPEEFEAFIREQVKEAAHVELKKSKNASKDHPNKDVKKGNQTHQAKTSSSERVLQGVVNEGFHASPGTPGRLNPSVLQSLLREEEQGKQPFIKGGKKNSHPSTSSPSAELAASRFRYINEKLYTQSGSLSKKMFREDPESFSIYHEGYANQVSKWPLDPLDCIVASMMRKSEPGVVVDMGCGEGRLGRQLPSHYKVHSFDFIALNENVTPCDMSKTPMESSAADIVVFCLSLMGTNIKDYLKEANRLLKVNGTLKIAEVESRFRETSADKFIQSVEKMGFKLKWKDLSKKVFYLMDFKKTHSLNSLKLPHLSLKPCIYKKR